MLSSLQEHIEIPLTDIGAYRDLAEVYAVWMDKCGGAAFPQHIDMLDLPPSLLPYVMVLERDPDAGLVIRLAGTYVCERHGGELRGKTPADFFPDGESQKVEQAILGVGEARAPSLAKRTYIHLNDSYWSYVRLVLPLSSDGHTVDKFFKVLDPATLSTVPKSELEAATITGA